MGTSDTWQALKPEVCPELAKKLHFFDFHRLAWKLLISQRSRCCFSLLNFWS